VHAATPDDVKVEHASTQRELLSHVHEPAPTHQSTDFICWHASLQTPPM
jgi:hypothetical protein